MNTDTSKYSPKNKQDAFCYQIADDVKVLQALALFGEKKAYNQKVDAIIELLKQSKL